MPFLLKTLDSIRTPIKSVDVKEKFIVDLKRKVKNGPHKSIFAGFKKRLLLKLRYPDQSELGHFYS